MSEKVTIKIVVVFLDTRRVRHLIADVTPGDTVDTIVEQLERGEGLSFLPGISNYDYKAFFDGVPVLTPVGTELRRDGELRIETFCPSVRIE